ncbi:hypothetical protein Halsa_1511 [Halanaerobium hydrogeniformans]|uniref:Uncharacterized protein n=1 Tax=Halanaerobium hydrogeniformans TaxID=656519 RepID=E4RLM2_HALHG|nr:hypothetical protein Halsa_1511 [Halanaerobium hydrogeniformans]
MIKKTGVFVVNLVSTDNKREFWYLDKFKTGITKMPVLLFLLLIYF